MTQQLAQVIYLDPKRKRGSSKPPKNFKWPLLAAAFAVGVGTVAYINSLGEGYNEYRARNDLTSLHSEYSTSCNESYADPSLSAEQKLAWVDDRKNKVLRLHGCDPRSIEWHC